MASATAAVKALPRPAHFHAVTPYLVLRNAAAGIDFYKSVFNAVECFRMPGPNNKVMHAEIQIGDSRLMIGEEGLENNIKSPLSLGGTPVSLYVYVDNVDQTYQTAVQAGAVAKRPVQLQFWGDRVGMFTDPYGHEWSVATHVEDIPPEEMGQRMKQQAAQTTNGQ